MKKLWILLVIVFVMSGCVTTQSNTNPLEQISQAINPYIKTLAKDWPTASGLIRGGLDEGYLPKKIVEKMDEIDSFFQDNDGNWIPADEVTLNEYQLGYIVGVRLALTGPALQAIIQQYAPGLLGLPQIMAGLAFLGL